MKGTKKSKSKQKFWDEFRHLINYIPAAIGRREILEPAKVRRYFEIYDMFKKKHIIHKLQAEFRDLKKKIIGYLIHQLGLPCRQMRATDSERQKFFPWTLIICIDEGVYVAFHVGDGFKGIKDLNSSYAPHIFNRMCIVDYLHKIKSQGIETVAEYHARYDKPKDKFNEYAKMMHLRIEKAAAEAAEFIKEKNKQEMTDDCTKQDNSTT